MRAYLLKRFGGKAIGAVTSVDCEAFLADLVAQGLAPNTIRNVWQVFRSVLRYALRHKAIPANPADAVDAGSTGTAAQTNQRFEHRPLTGPQVALLATQVGERYPVYEVLVLFMAYTGLRAAEVQGLEVRDLVLTVGPDGKARGSVRVQRTKTRRRREWVTGTPKSKTSKRTLPLPDWLAGRMCSYLATVHPYANTPTAVLWPRRLHGNQNRKPQLNWSEPLDLNGLQSKIIRPALEAVGLPASRPATTLEDGTVLPATKCGSMTFGTPPRSCGLRPASTSSRWRSGSGTVAMC